MQAESQRRASRITGRLINIYDQVSDQQSKPRLNSEEVTSVAMGGRSQKVRSTLVELLNEQEYFWEEQAALEFLPR